jgi:hypothetical protein
LILLLGLLIGDLGLILAGIAALRNRHWDGWRAYSLLAVGLFPFVSILILHPSLLPAWINIPKSSQAELGFWLGGLFSLCWLAVGLALWVDNGRLALSGKQVLGSGMMQ